MRHAALATFVGLTAAGLLAGCPDRSISEVDPVQGRVEFKDIPVNINRNVDLLFVIDNSPSMNDKQNNLADNFEKFIQVLDSIQGGRPNVHIAVVTSDIGTKSAHTEEGPGPTVGRINMGGCSGVGQNGIMQLSGAMLNGDVFISDIDPNGDGNRVRNYGTSAAQLGPVFKTMAKVGAGGCGFEQHLEAMKLALQPVTAPNRGFLREDAYLAVIFIADEDDCSQEHSVGPNALLAAETSTLGAQQSFRCTRFGVLCDTNGQNPNAMNAVGAKAKCHPNDDSPYLTKVSDYVTFLKGLKADPLKVIVAGIMGPNDPFATELRAPQGSNVKIPALAHSCSYIGGDGLPEVADPAVRLRFFLDQFPNRSTFAPICQRDLSGGLQQIGDLLKTVIGDPCIEGKLAVVATTNGVPEYDCAVSSVRTIGTPPVRDEKIIPKCDPPNGSGTSEPCWHLVEDTVNCKNNDHLTLTIEHKDLLLSDTHVVANCVTEVTN